MAPRPSPGAARYDPLRTSCPTERQNETQVAPVLPGQPRAGRGARPLRLDGAAARRLAGRRAAARRRSCDCRGPAPRRRLVRPRRRGVPHDRALQGRLALGGVHHHAGGAHGLLDAQRVRGADRQRLRLRVGRARARGHQLPRGAGLRLAEGDARRRRVRGEDHRRRARPGPRRAEDRRAARQARPDPARHEHGAAGRTAGLRDRQPVRARLHAHHRHRERARPDDPERQQRVDLRRDPDGRRDQPGQLGRRRCSTAAGG